MTSTRISTQSDQMGGGPCVRGALRQGEHFIAFAEQVQLRSISR